jgi:histone H3/H4
MIKGQLNKAIKSTKGFQEYKKTKTKMSKEISREEFEKLVKSYGTKILNEIIKNGFEGVESLVRVAMSDTLDTKINQNKEDE